MEPQNVPLVSNGNILAKKIKSIGKAALILGIFMSFVGVIAVLYDSLNGHINVAKLVLDVIFVIIFVVIIILGATLMKTIDSKTALTKIMTIQWITIGFIVVAIISDIIQKAGNGWIGIILALALVIDLLVARSRIKKLS